MTKNTPFIIRLLSHKPLHNWMYHHHFLTSKVFDGATIEFCRPKSLAHWLAPTSGMMNVRIDNFIYSVDLEHSSLLVAMMNKPKNIQELASAILAFQNEHPGVMKAYRVHADGSLIKTN